MIFCVDDDSAIRDIEVYTLQQTGFKAKGLSCADELFLELKNVIPDLASGYPFRPAHVSI